MPTLKNPKHELFAQELAKGTTAEKSYEAAGFKPSRHNAATLARKQHILDRVAQVLAERERMHGQSTAKAIARVALTKEWVLAKLIDNVQRASQAVPVLDAEGKPTGEYRYQGAVANRALELLGKHLGMFVELHELSGKDGGPIQTEEVSARGIILDRLAGRAARSGEGGDTGKPH
jgi:phage terminase small subunit